MKATFPQSVVNDQNFPLRQVWNVCRSILRDANLADDACQEAYLRWEKDAATPWKVHAIYASREVRRKHFGNTRKGSLRKAARPLVRYVTGHNVGDATSFRRDVREVLSNLEERHAKLSQRMKTVAVWLASGATQRDVADYLGVSVRMVERLVATLRGVYESTSK